jgi:MATE family multidrug resistance protein
MLPQADGNRGVVCLQEGEKAVMELGHVSASERNLTALWQRPGGYREVIWLAFPVVLSMLSQTLMWIVDTVFLGRVGTTEQGAAGLAGPFLWTLMALCMGIGTGVNILVAQYYGAQTRTRCGRVAWQGLYISLLAWLPLVAFGLAAHHLIRFSHPSPALLEPATLYLRIRLLGALTALINFTLVGFFRGLGDTQTPLRITVLVNSLNGLLDYLLIFGHLGLPRLGIAGAAVATVIATSVGSCFYVWLFLQRGKVHGLLTRAFVSFDRYECRRLVRMSVPVGLQGALEMSAWMFFTIFVARLGAVETAAHHIATNILTLSYMPGNGVSVAATTLVGQYLGADNPLAARRSAHSCLGVIILLMGTLGAGFFLWRHELVWLFNHDARVIHLGAKLLIFTALFQVFDGLSLVSAGVLRGAGDTRWPMLAGVVVGWGFFVPLAYVSIFPWQGGVIGGWLAAMVYAMVLGLTMGFRLAQGKWQHRSLKIEDRG